MSELLSCPFCGGEAVGFEWSDDSYRDDETEPHEPDAYCSVKVNHKKDCILEVGEFYSWIASTEAEAAELWNTRAERTCHPFVSPDGAGWYAIGCSNCGHGFADNNPDKAYLLRISKRSDIMPRYCQNCGAKVEVVE